MSEAFDAHPNLQKSSFGGITAAIKSPKRRRFSSWTGSRSRLGGSVAMAPSTKLMMRKIFISGAAAMIGSAMVSYGVDTGRCEPPGRLWRRKEQ